MTFGAKMTVVERWAAGPHPCEMALTGTGQFRFAGNASRNAVIVTDATKARAIDAPLFTLGGRGV